MRQSLMLHVLQAAQTEEGRKALLETPEHVVYAIALPPTEDVSHCSRFL